jgi:hypothetical protein
MNESSLTQLKIIVERAVRPVRASKSGKRKMREELLAHVSGVFEEEFAQLGDESAALARTSERFGQPAELAAQLRASVPRRVDSIRLFGEAVVGYRSTESALRLAGLAAMLLGALCSVIVGIAILIQVLRGQGSEWLTIAWIPSLLTPLEMGFLAFCGTLLMRGIRRALFGPAGRSWLRAGLMAVAAWIMIPVATFGNCMALLPDVQSSLRGFLVMLPFGALVPLTMLVVAYGVDAECRRDQDWADLQID